MKNIGQRIRTRRKELKLTIPQIHVETGLSTGNLSGIELGKYYPSANALISLSRILNCSIDWILTGNEYHNSDIADIKDDTQANFFNDNLSITQELVLTLFDELTEDDQKDIVKIIKSKLKNKSTEVSNKTSNIVPENKKNTAKSYPFLIK